ncbi:hypothetical protein, partial [Chryseobacterium lacus]|uniref:hypothetical protein n=1 Tax=Chryseobacterium lacus TaxID=2058346 RepID=UPI0014077D18
QYNIRGWLTKINEPTNLNGKLFGYEIKYTSPEEATARYNGNIAEIDRAKAIGFNEPTIRRYSYSYDAINRLTHANFSEPNTAMNIFTSTNRRRRFADSIKKINTREAKTILTSFLKT